MSGKITEASILTKFAYTPTTVSIFQEQEGTVLSELTPGVYELKQSMTGLYLARKGKNFAMPPKLYGNIQPRADKVLRAYQYRTKSTGVMLLGDKGCGKTELMKLTANDAINKLGLPVIQITEPFPASAIQGFLAQCGPVCVIFDEFAKIYERYATDDQKGDPQADLLSMFDGFGCHKNLNIITENDRSKINSYMKNRPGRFYYRWEYGKLDISVIEEYCLEKGVNHTFLSDLVVARNASDLFSFDIMQAVVAEHLQYPEETFKNVVADMNVTLQEPKLELHIKNVDHAGVNLGLLEITNDTMYDFKPDSNRAGYSNTVRLRPTALALRKFGEEHELFTVVQAAENLATGSDAEANLEKLKQDIHAREDIDEQAKSNQDYTSHAGIRSFYVNKSREVFAQNNKFVHFDKDYNAEITSEAVISDNDTYTVGEYNSYGTRFESTED